MIYADTPYDQNQDETHQSACTHKHHQCIHSKKQQHTGFDFLAFPC